MSDKYKPTNCATVGELIDVLSGLPREMRIMSSFSESYDVVVFNQGLSTEHLCFEDGGDWT